MRQAGICFKSLTHRRNSTIHHNGTTVVTHQDKAYISSKGEQKPDSTTLKTTGTNVSFMNYQSMYDKTYQIVDCVIDRDADIVAITGNWLDLEIQ